MYVILIVILLLMLTDYLRQRHQGSLSRSVAVRTLRNRTALIAGGAVLVLALLGGLLLSGGWNITLPLALLLGGVVALLVGVTTGGAGPLGKRTGQGSGRVS